MNKYVTEALLSEGEKVLLEVLLRFLLTFLGTVRGFRRWGTYERHFWLAHGSELVVLVVVGVEEEVGVVRLGVEAQLHGTPS